GAGHAIARTHRAAALAPALADADTPRRGEREAAAVVGKGEMGERLRRLVRRAEAEIVVNPVRIDDFARIHLSVGIPDALELPKRVHQFGTEHLRQELRPGLTVAVLARERTADRQNQIRRLYHERLVLVNTRPGFEVEIDSRVHAPLAEESIQGSRISVAYEQPPQVAQVATEVCRRYRRVFPPFPGDRFSRHACRRAETGLADPPDQFFHRRIVV